MLPLRYDLIRLGGSWAQRQVFNVTMIQAAIKANKPSLAFSILAELKVSDQLFVSIITAIILLLQAQKSKSKRLQQLFDELKTLVLTKR